MDKSNGSRDLSTDALVEILVRLPPNARRRLRLVCRRWRKLIDQRTATDMRRRTEIIAVTEKGHACVVDLLTPGSNRSLWQQHRMAGSIVGTCNGLVCLCNEFAAGAAITVANPSTGEVLRIPPLLMPMPVSTVLLGHYTSNSSWWWLHRTYSFAYHPTTGRYKIVHVPPCSLNLPWKPDIVHVFTLGEASWQDVHVGTDARCSLGSSIADVDGMVYWLTEDPRKIMSFDLKHDRVTQTEPLPVPATPGIYRLTKVHGRLGLAVGDDYSVTLWILEGERWTRRYFLEANMQQHKAWMTQELSVPLFVHGDYFVTLGWSGELLRRHKMKEAARSQDGVMQKKHRDRGEAVTRLPNCISQMFAYVETKEPLSVYNVCGFGA